MRCNAVVTRGFHAGVRVTDIPVPIAADMRRNAVITRRSNSRVIVAKPPVSVFADVRCSTVLAVELALSRRTFQRRHLHSDRLHVVDLFCRGCRVLRLCCVTDEDAYRLQHTLRSVRMIDAGDVQISRFRQHAVRDQRSTRRSADHGIKVIRDAVVLTRDAKDITWRGCRQSNAALPLVKHLCAAFDRD